MMGYPQQKAQQKGTPPKIFLWPILVLYVLWRLAMGLAEDEEDNIDYPLVI